MREKARCESDFAYLCQKYLHIKAKDVIGLPTLRLNPVQQLLYDRMQEQRRRTGWIRQVWGKSRQIGASTLVRALSFHQTAFADNRNAFLCAHDEPSALEMFANHDKLFLDKLPAPLRPKVSRDAKDGLVFPGRNSKVTVGHALNVNVGASQMNHVVHLTEAARYGRHAETVQASLSPSISSAKGEDCSIVIVESTSEFGGDWFKQFAEDARDGKNEFAFTFVPWYLHPDYTRPIPRGLRLSAFERELKQRYPLTDGNIVWYREQQAHYRHNPALLMQSYPFSWEESWQLPKGALRVFKDDILLPLRAGLRPGERVVPKSTGLEPAFAGPVEIWATPEPGVFYDLGADVALGGSADADWTVLCVIRRDTLEQVAQMRVHLDPASPEFLDLTYWLAWAYNTAQVIIDTTGGFGHALLSELRRRAYPNLWRWRNRRDAKERVSSKEGFNFTSADDRDALVYEAVTEVARGQVVIHAEALYEEMRVYLNTGLHEYRPSSKSYYDDTVIAWMLALMAARDERQEWAPEPEPAPPPSVREPWRHHDVDHDLKPDDDLMVAIQPWGA